MPIAKENVNFNFLQRVAISPVVTQALLDQIVMSELTNIADQIAEADNYHELTKHVAEQIISQFDTLVMANKNMSAQMWKLLNTAKRHGLFSRNEMVPNVSGPSIVEPLAFSTSSKNTKPNNQAYRLLADYQRGLKAVRFSSNNQIFKLPETEGDRREKAREESAIKKLNEWRKSR